ncbi:GNAT family N-acetyltransferase [Chitinophaga sp. Ak27]|uniref:GNAT family N-acetyltransferase n=1 Tax=Chitinophaga sp. Ak27 TaxID=2726116 RepID=UPI00145E220F|nr:GNAT family N-acetyltransferase [Chitinophaga sp. Ak27]NLU91490.1 GNAT family N-acetyltransferase [Chitinophaga sp. Ak27]
MIRPFKPIDEDTLIDIFQLNVPRYFDPKEIEDFRQYLARHSDTYLTIEHDGKIVGGAGYYINTIHHSGSITWIFFHPDVAGRGLGKEVVAYCMKIFNADPGIKKLVVTTSQLAWKFFEKCGYQLIRTEKDYWGKGLDLYLMERDNTPPEEGARDKRY